MFLIYRFLTTVFFPILVILIYLRKFFGKEDSIRFKEKIFPSSFNFKKENKSILIWFHGASIGEITSVIPLIGYLKIYNKDIKILITTVTLSSGKIVEEKFSNDKNIYHQYFPLDVNHLTKRFLEIWKPDLVGFIDSEIWPNFILNIKKKGIPLILINGRITKKTFNRWKILRTFSNKVFRSFDLCLPSSKESENNLANLNAKNIKYFGNLKFISNNTEKQKLNDSTIQFLSKKKVWCAASTHKQEETFCLKAHQLIKKVHKNVITVIIPRHIGRINNIFKECKDLNLSTQIINQNEKIREDCEILLVNSYGVLQQYYNYCKSVFVGKSLIKKFHLVGGQNPIEAAVEGCKIYHGPYIYNFQEIYNFLKTNGISEKIYDIPTLSSKIIQDLFVEKKVDVNNIKKINDYGQSILEKTALEISNLIKK